MPQYIITTPDGKKLKVNAPEGATKEQALAYVRSTYKPQAAPQEQTQPEYSPSDVPAMENFLAGAGKAVVDLGRGIRQVGAEAGNRVGLVSDETVAGLRSQQDETARLDAPLMGTKAGIAGNIAGNIGTIYAGGGALQAPAMLGRAQGLATLGRTIAAPNTYKAAGAVGAGVGALQPVGADGSRAANTGIGGALGVGGQALAVGLGRIADPIRRSLSGADRRAVDVLENAGVPLDAAQKSGSPVLNRVKSALRDNPVTLPAQTEQYSRQQTAFTRAALKTIGANADMADETTMGAAKANIAREFEDVLTTNSVRIASGFEARVGALANRSKRLVAGDTNQITRTIDDILDHAKQNGGKIDGRFYNTIRGDIAALESERGIAPVARELRETLDNAFQQAAKPGDAKRLQDARRLWRNMRVIENAIDNEGGGMISPAKLANQFGTKKNRAVGVYGQGDKSILELSRLAKAGKRLIPDKLPNSGTVPRALAQAALPAAVGAAYGGIKEGDLSGAVTYGLGAAALPYAIQRGMNAPRAANYLSSGLRSGQARNALLGLERAATLRLLPIAATPAVVSK